MHIVGTVTSLVELSTGELVFGAVVLLIASYIRGYSGFGFSAVLVAGATFVIAALLLAGELTDECSGAHCSAFHCSSLASSLVR